jgi:hypothetical protein
MVIVSNLYPEIAVLLPLDTGFTHHEYIHFGVQGHGVSEYFNGRTHVGRDTIENQIADTTIVVKLLNETIKIFRVFNTAQTKVYSVNMFVLHQNKLDYFCFQICDAEVPKSEAVKAAFFLKHRRAHVEETLGVLELTALNIKFANCFALTETST